MVFETARMAANDSVKTRLTSPVERQTKALEQKSSCDKWFDLVLNIILILMKFILVVVPRWIEAR